MREASHNSQSRNDVQCTWESTQLLQFSAWKKGTHLHSIKNCDLEIVICVGYMPPPLIFNTSYEVICRLPQCYRLDGLCASLGLARQSRAEGPRCIWPQNIGRACVMPIPQIQTCCPRLVLNFHNRFNAVLYTYTPIIAICEWNRGPCVKARATKTTNSHLETYCCLTREARVSGVLVVRLRVNPWASPVTLDLVL